MEKRIIRIKDPVCLFGITFKMEYWDKKYHSGIIWGGVNKKLILKKLSGWER